MLERFSVFEPSDHTFAICAYGESPYLEACIESVLHQSVRSNVIISTSTPNEHIRSLADRYALRLFINEGAPEIAHDWNCAIGHCSTSLVTIAHQDDVYDYEYVAMMLKLLNRAQRPLIFFSNYGELRGSEKVYDNRLLHVKQLLLTPLKNGKRSASVFWRRRCLSLGCSICCPAVTFNVNDLPKPIFKAGFKSNLDWEAWESISRLSGDFLYCSKPLMLHRVHNGSETSALIEDHTRTHEDYEMLKKFWPAPVAKLINFFYSEGQKSNTVN